MLPRVEIKILRGLSILAIDMALAGYPAEGYTSLLNGLGRVITLRDAGEPFGEELIGQYHRTLDEYAGRYGVARD
jgi:hypothetical protein